jgi:2-aminoadipate transaminase
MSLASKLAKRAVHIRSGAISQLLKLAAQADTLSLAGGHPATDMLPAEEIEEIGKDLLGTHGPGILQYGESKGYFPLRESLADYLREKKGISCHVEEVGVSSGSQNAIDAIAKILIDPGDSVVVESPTFFYSIQTLGLYEPDIVQVASDECGIIPDALEDACRKTRVKLLYVIPCFQNPTGRTTSFERRKDIVTVAKKHDVLIIEDDPYFELRYVGDNILPLKVLAPEIVVYVGSLSKVFSPGMRIGYYVAPEELCDLVTAARQVVDIHANGYAQAVACEFLRRGLLEPHLARIGPIYHGRLNGLLDALEQFLADTPFSWTRPDGGLFVWLDGPPSFDSTECYFEALERKVSFVPGEFFFFDRTRGKNSLRLSFANLCQKSLATAIERLADILTE